MCGGFKSLALELNERFQNRMGLLISPSTGWKNPQSLKFAVDNGKFSVWPKGLKWDKREFMRLLDKATTGGLWPEWIVVPDSVGNAAETFELWSKWASRFNGIRIALAVQDGMTPDAVKLIHPQPDVIFVGGTTEWKWQTLRKWTTAFPRVHVGRANTPGLLWKVQIAGA